MSDPTKSYLKVHYELRPAKQVERRMIIDALQILGENGFPVREYRYTGMGSVYFIDFILFHRILGIESMTSVEYDEGIAKRVEFNRPFEFVDVQIKPIGDVIPSLSPDQRHLLWLDYDGIITGNQLQDISLAATFLTRGSILLITVDVEPPTDTNDPEDWKQYYLAEAASYLDEETKTSAFAKSKLPTRTVELVDKAIKNGLAGRTEVEFIPLFNFLYRDTHSMITIGGMIGGSAEKRRIRGSGLVDTFYYRHSLNGDPCLIKVPLLTRKERQYLDGFMPYSDSWLPQDFEMSSDLVLAYRDIYRFCPSYAELLL